jgi:hypothetical protein
MPKQSLLNRITSFLYLHRSPWIYRPYCALVLVPSVFAVVGFLEGCRWLKNVGTELCWCAEEISDWTREGRTCFWHRFTSLVRVGWCKPADRDSLLDRLLNH